MNSKIKKIILFSSSLLICLVSLEMLLYIFGKKIESNNAVNILKNYETKNHLEISLRENKDHIKIVTMGDSFTFGGYGKESESYPSQLKSIIDNKIDIVNNGMCERTSGHILASIEHAINLNSPNLIILLVGAANRFAPVIEERTFFNSLKIVKILKMFKIYKKEIDIRNKFNIGSSNSYLDSILKKFETGEIDYNDYEVGEMLIKAYEIQSQKTAKEVAYFLEYIKESKKLEEDEKIILDMLIAKFNSFEKWDVMIADRLRSDLQKISKIAKSQGVTLVLATYPVKYVAVNNVIRSVGESEGLEIIDHEKYFSDLIAKNNYSEYIKDDDHATKKGHYEMALNTKKALDKIIGEKKSKLLIHGSEQD